MKISRLSLAKQLAESGDRVSVMSMIQTLLVLMRTFGKSLNNPEVSSVMKKNFPDALELYDILGRSRCTIAQCQQLLVSVSHMMDHNHLEINTLGDTTDLGLNKDDTISSAGSSLIGLSVIGKGKIYKRSLESDLMKMAN